MVDISEAMEGEFVGVDMVKASLSKKMIVLDPGSYEEADYGKEKVRRLTIGVNLDGKLKRYRPNKESLDNLKQLGKDTISWVGKVIEAKVEKRSGREAVIAFVGVQQ